MLLPLLDKKFPYHTADPYRVKCFAGNTFRICEYLPMKRSNILCILIEQISVVDVSATVLMVLHALVGLFMGAFVLF